MSLNIRNVINFSKKIEANNALFEGLTAKGQRLAIAKDALAQLVTEQTTAQSGVYCEVPGTKPYHHWDVDAIANLLRNAPKCTVCAKGALFLSSLRVDKNFEVPDNTEMYMGNVTDGVDSFDSAFNQSDMNLMERIFETYTGVNSIEAAFDDEQDARRAGWEPDIEYELQYIVDSNVRLFGILANIVENEGNFKPRKARSLDAIKTFVKATTTRYDNAVTKYGAAA